MSLQKKKTTKTLLKKIFDRAAHSRKSTSAMRNISRVLLRSHVQNGALNDGCCFCQLCFSDHQGWCQTDNVLVGWFAQHAPFHQFCAQLSCCHSLGIIYDNGIEQASTPYCLDQWAVNG
mmetsp:Transcript_6062/g.11863  ORF Transcript_6062/g.11863 Transcript_6062/m.11863 type:complete len:119 (+) Transcript_6062:3-359(+)